MVAVEGSGSAVCSVCSACGTCIGVGYEGGGRDIDVDAEVA